MSGDGPGVALLHGGLHGSWCWDGCLPFIDAPAIAIDLPGRDGDPADIDRITAAQWTDSAVQQTEQLGTRTFVLVAHSLGGVTALRIATRLGRRMRHLVLVAALVPAEGQTAADVIADGTGAAASDIFDATGAFAPPAPDVARTMLANDLPEPAGERLVSRLRSEPRGPLLEPFGFAGFPDVPITYVRTRRDLGVPPDKQQRMIANLPHEPRVIELDAGHNAMISRPQELADVINEIVREPA
jgi:pimeloyl-ACP methyl ester carboxylesterase